MTAREWPDFAFISWRSQSGRSGGSDVALRCSRAYDESHWRTQSFGEIPDHKVIDVRRLVVIDPEDREQVERLDAAIERVVSNYAAGRCGGVDALQSGLREFANPTPPKPDEPTGLGAVVVDSNDVTWVLAGRDLPTTSPDNWRAFDGPCVGDWKSYHRINAVRILSEGVTS